MSDLVTTKPANLPSAERRERMAPQARASNGRGGPTAATGGFGKRSTSGMAGDHGYRHLLPAAACGGCPGGDARVGSAPASARPLVRQGGCERRVNRGDVLIGATTPCAATRCSLGAKRNIGGASRNTSPRSAPSSDRHAARAPFDTFVSP